MKRKVFLTTICFFIVFAFCVTSISFSASELWPKKKGELCWNAYREGIADPYGLVRLFVFNTGNNHYLVHGSNTEIDTITFANGNAIVYSDEIVMHVSSSGYETNEVRGFLGTVNLDRATLDGTVRGVSITWEHLYPGGEIKYDGVTELEYIPCP